MHAPARPSPHGHAVSWALCLGLAASCSDGNVADAATWLEFQSATSQVNEGDISDAMRVVLRTRLPELESDVEFDLVASEFSTANEGFDFTPIANTGCRFDAGTMDGASMIIDIAALSDARSERPIETLQLSLAARSEGVALGPLAMHTVEILDSDLATVHFVGVSAVATEGSGAIAIEFELGLDVGVSLDAPLEVQLVEAVGGNAVLGVDYEFASALVLMPAGSIDGARFSCVVEVLDDLELEGEETVVFALFASAGTPTAVAPTRFTLRITDDEAGVGTQLIVHSDPLGVPEMLDAGAVIDMGAVSSSAGLPSQTAVRLSSIGSNVVTLGLPLITGAHEREFAVRFSEPDVSAGELHDTPMLHPSPLRCASSAAPIGVALGFEQELGDFAPQLRAMRWLDVPTAFGALALDLRRLPSPWSSDALLVVDGEPRERETVELTHWRGSIAGEANSDVMLTLGARAVHGWVRRADGALQHWTTVRDAERTRSLAFGDSDWNSIASRAFEATCHEPVSVVGRDAPRNNAPGGARGLAATWPTARIALETDYQFYQRFGDVGALVDYVEALIAAASARYSIDVGVRLEIAYLGVHTNPNDGWTAPDNSGSAVAVLDEFQHAWAPAWGGNKPVPAHLAHFLSGAELGGGVAYVGTLCDLNWGFAVSGDMNAAIDWPGWTGAAGPLMWDFVVFTHELGHNFGSLHTHTYCPPLDECFESCSPSTQCTRGTLMSYCHICGGVGNVDLELHPFTANIMRSQVNTSCLGSIELAPGTAIDWSLHFRPQTPFGSKMADIGFEHDALNVASEFELHLNGTSTP